MNHRSIALSRAALLALTVFPVSSFASAQFVSGDVYYTATTGEIINVTSGGDFTGELFVDTDQYSIGQLAWSADLATMYLSLFTTGEVVAIDPAGNVTTFASGLSGPTGLLLTNDGTFLAAEFDTGEITDISGGGSMAGVAPLTTGLSGPRHLAQLSDGTVLVADQDLDAVFDALYPSGGAVGEPFAAGLIEVRAMIATDDDTIYAATREFVSEEFTGFVYDITGGGDFAAAAPFASGQSFFSLTVSGAGRLLSGELFGSVIWDITGGGDFSTSAAFATGLPEGETPLGTVPQASTGSGGAGGAGASGAGGSGGVGGSAGPAGGAGGAAGDDGGAGAGGDDGNGGGGCAVTHHREDRSIGYWALMAMICLLATRRLAF